MYTQHVPGGNDILSHWSVKNLQHPRVHVICSINFLAPADVKNVVLEGRRIYQEWFWISGHLIVLKRIDPFNFMTKLDAWGATERL